MSEKRTPRALAMFSGGLDSLLATKVMMNLGVEVLGLHFTAPFIDAKAALNQPSRAQQRAERLGLPLREIDVWPGYLAILKNPQYGHGKHLNPCVDCKIFFLRQARQIMEAEGYDFVFTGEVLGQRPMSQHRPSLQAILNQSGLQGRLLRPLCAKLLEPTIPEQEGLIDREKLFAFSGRSRKPQLALAAELGIDDPPGSAGGCLLTDANYAARLQDLLSWREPILREDLHLLTVGRHLKLPSGGKVIVSRNEQENHLLEKWQAAGTFLVSPVDWPGPDALIIGSRAPEALPLVAGLVQRWGKPQAGRAVLAVDLTSGGKQLLTSVPPNETEINHLFIR
jgi:tRNA U34 2-thiouridine synthase MnmA/TrmU